MTEDLEQLKKDLEYQVRLAEDRLNSSREVRVLQQGVTSQARIRVVRAKRKLLMQILR